MIYRRRASIMLPECTCHAIEHTLACIVASLWLLLAPLQHAERSLSICRHFCVREVDQMRLHLFDKIVTGTPHHLIR